MKLIVLIFKFKTQIIFVLFFLAWGQAGFSNDLSLHFCACVHLSEHGHAGVRDCGHEGFAQRVHGCHTGDRAY